MASKGPLSGKEINAVRTAYHADRAGFLARAGVTINTIHRALAGEVLHRSTRVVLLAALSGGSVAAT